MKKSKKGAALVNVILVLVVASVLSLALLNIALGNTKQTVLYHKDMQAHYLARSGANLGYALLQDTLLSQRITDMATLISTMNGRIAALPAGDKEIDSVGTYVISYKMIDATEITILSTGTTEATPSQTDAVSIRIRLISPYTTVNNPSEWVTGINLAASVRTSENYAGQGVELEGKPIRSPKGGNSYSIFQASAILFTDFDGLSLYQINNSVNITFDSEILYFQTGVDMNHDDTTKGKNKVILAVSNDILGKWTSPGRLKTALTNTGFESAARYAEFVNGLTYPGYVNYSATFTTTYPNFISGTHYGIVRFGGNVREMNNKTLIKTHVDTSTYKYYFFANDTELKDIQPNELIPIRNDDILIKAIDSMFQYSVNPTDDRLWSEE